MGGSTRGRVVWAATAFLLGCPGGQAVQDEPDAAVDAGPDAAAPDAGGFTPDPPAPPEPVVAAAEATLPDLGPCPLGWRAVGANPATCEPWPEEGHREDCGADEAHLPGAADCERIGRPCPEGEWPEDLPDDGPLHVRPGAEPAGDGSVARPFATIAEALSVATPGAVVALARGTYDEIVEPPVAVTLRGACTAETILAPSAPHDTDAALRATGVALTVQDLRISGERPGIAATGAGAALTLEGVVVSSVVAYALYADAGASVDGHDVVVRDVRGRPSDGALGRAIEVRTAARLTLARVAIERVRQVGLLSWDPASSLSLTDASISDVAAGSEGELGIGAIAGLGASLALERAIVDRAHFTAIIAGDSGTRVELTDVIVRDTEPEPASSAMGRGIDVEQHATAALTRVLVERSHEAGVVVALADVLANDLVVRGTVRQLVDGLGGSGIVVQDGGIAQGARWVFDGNERTGVRVLGAATRVEVDDVTIRDTLANDLDENVGRGLEIGDGAAITARRVRIERSVDAGIAIAGAAGVALEDLTVLDTRAAPIEESGRGVSIWEGGPVRFSRARIERNVTAGILVAGPSSLVTLEDLAVADTAATPDTGHWGRGLSVQGGAAVTLARGRFTGNREIALLSAEEGTILDVTDVSVSDTHAREVDGLAGLGLGLAAYQGAVVHTILRRPSAVASAAKGQYVDAETREFAGSMAGAAAEAERAGAFHGGAFWARRTFKAARSRAPIPPLARAAAPRLDGQALELAGDARIEPRVVLEGWLFEERPALVSTHWPAGLRYLGGVDVPAAIRAAAEGGTTTAIAERHRRLSGRDASAEAIETALEHLLAVGALRRGG
jgi:hypothetical protein